MLIAGEEFGGAASVAAIIAGAQMIKLFGPALEPGLLALGRAGGVLIAQGLSSVAHLTGLLCLLPVLASKALVGRECLRWRLWLRRYGFNCDLLLVRRL